MMKGREGEAERMGLLGRFVSLPNIGLVRADLGGARVADTWQTQIWARIVRRVGGAGVGPHSSDLARPRSARIRLLSRRTYSSKSRVYSERSSRSSGSTRDSVVVRWCSPVSITRLWMYARFSSVSRFPGSIKVPPPTSAAWHASRLSSARASAKCLSAACRSACRNSVRTDLPPRSAQA
jgi:hypothetical protein